MIHGNDIITRKEIFEVYRYRCINCNHAGVVIHESPPRSLLPNGEWKKFKYRFLLCVECHAKAHEFGTEKSHYWLVQARKKRLSEYNANIEYNSIL